MTSILEELFGGEEAMSNSTVQEIRKFPALKENDPLITSGKTCLGCDQPFKVGDETTVYPIGPGDDPEARKKAAQGRAYTGRAIPLHWVCAVGELPKEEPKPISEDEKRAREAIMALDLDDDLRKDLEDFWVTVDQDPKQARKLELKAREMIATQMLVAPPGVMWGTVLGFIQMFGKVKDKRVATVAHIAVQKELKAIKAEKEHEKSSSTQQ